MKVAQSLHILLKNIKDKTTPVTSKLFTTRLSLYRGIVRAVCRRILITERYRISFKSKHTHTRTISLLNLTQEKARTNKDLLTEISMHNHRS